MPAAAGEPRRLIEQVTFVLGVAVSGGWRCRGERARVSREQAAMAIPLLLAWRGGRCAVAVPVGAVAGAVAVGCNPDRRPGGAGGGPG